ncbi:BadF/BadG/BcrA/BcrD ATPase family protein [Methylobrevis albus]|uniref:N-acetylglucosamine kinase n=1 Tax=Methylobrevis albus TaxID=2793297 RepID=A0A931I0P6_9HYPH|nr:BadF/BadG/BcrA/BcrD ATPase family protein [Methylobrevis albus]MBH0237185.1 N-acetylglucosamine kinase [Methylobrevis albus]
MLRTPRFFIGVDGGGTGCRARLVDRDGRILAEGRGGPANLTLGLEPATAALAAAVGDAFAAAGLGPADRADTDAAFGLAGVEASGTAAALAAHAFGLGRLAVVSDAETACLGAHAGRDGAILILGTGSQGYARRGAARIRVGGWGFAISDGGSGAVLGQRAVRRALAAHEGLAPASALTAAVMQPHADAAALCAWSLGARPADYGALAPLVFAHAEAGDRVALALRDEAVAEVEALVGVLAGQAEAPVALVGGLAAVYRPLLGPQLAPILALPAGDAMDGALMLARRA